LEHLTGTSAQCAKWRRLLQVNQADEKKVREILKKFNDKKASAA